MYKGMKHIPHGAVIWEDWMDESLDRVNKYIKKNYQYVVHKNLRHDNIEPLCDRS